MKTLRAHLKKIIIPLTFLGLLLLVVPAISHAIVSPIPAETTLNVIGGGLGQTLVGAVSGFIGQILVWIAYAISFVMGVFVAFEAWIITFLLNVNTGLTTSPPVQIGFTVSLAVANLGFVLALIVVAIATIIRSSRYGWKSLLFKLVVAAIMVNFSLVIAKVMLDVSDGLSFYFMKSVAGQVENQAPTAHELAQKFSNGVINAFGPQKNILQVTDSNSQEVENLNTENLGSLLGPLALLIFTIAAFFGIVVTLGAFVVILVVRYVTLGIMMIMMPFIWLLWIFPFGKGEVDKYVSKFIKWALYPPIVMFFLWIAIHVASQIDPEGKNAYGLKEKYTTDGAANDPSSPWTALNSLNFAGLKFGDFFIHMMQLSIVIGLMFGGLVAAETVSVEIGKKGMAVAKGGAMSFSGYLGRRAAYTGGRLTYNNKLGASLMRRLGTKVEDRYDATTGKWDKVRVNRFGASRIPVIGTALKKTTESMQKYSDRFLGIRNPNTGATVVKGQGAQFQGPGLMRSVIGATADGLKIKIPSGGHGGDHGGGGGHTAGGHGGGGGGGAKKPAGGGGGHGGGGGGHH